MPDESSLPIQLSLTILKGLHQRWVVLFESLQTDDWRRTAYHPEIGKITAADLLHSYADHSQAHPAQMKRTLVARDA